MNSDDLALGPKNEASKPSLDQLVPKSDFTHRVIENLFVEDKSLHRSLFTGAILRSCQFQDVDFSRSDLDGMRIESCQFIRCNLEGADIRSSVISRSKFQDSNLNSAMLTDCTVVDSVMDGCAARSSVISRTSFVGSRLSRCELTRASCTLNTFTSTEFSSMSLGDCTFLYMIFRSCLLNNVSMNAESLGLSFGISLDQISKMHILYLGDQQSMPEPAEIPAVLLDSYAERNWAMGIAVVSINFGMTSIALALHSYLQSSLDDLASGRAVRTEELHFLVDVLRELRSQERLPLLTLIEFSDAFSSLLYRLDQKGITDDLSRERLEIQRFAGEIYYLIQEQLDIFEASRLRFGQGSNSDEVNLEITFEDQPSIDIISILNELSQASGFQIGKRSSLLAVRRGSYIEIVSTVLFSVLSLQMLLFLLNGCIIQVTEMKARLRALTRKRLPPQYARDALAPAQTMPAHLMRGFRHLAA